MNQGKCKQCGGAYWESHKGARDVHLCDSCQAVEDGREHIATIAEADNEHAFAREVRAGAWDHRNDVAAAIQRAKDGDLE